MTQLPGYYTVEEAAPVLGIHPESVRRIIRGGKLAAYTVGNTQLIPALLLETFAAEYSPRHKGPAAQEIHRQHVAHERRRAALRRTIETLQESK